MEFKIGDIVIAPIFGEGRIVDMNRLVGVIEFFNTKHGTRRVPLNLIKLK